MLIKGGTVVTATRQERADVRVRGETIAEIGPDLSAGLDEEVIDASGCLIFPGGVDPHTHFRLEMMGTVTADDFESGTIAALCGGTTTCIDFLEARPGQSLLSALEERRAQAQGAMADYTFHAVVKEFDEGTNRQLAELVAAGITSVKVFMAYKGRLQLEDAKLIRVLEASGDHGFLVMVHAENGEMIEWLIQRFVSRGCLDPEYHEKSRPPETEAEAVHRLAAYARLVGQPVYVVHLSSAEGLDEVRRARSQGTLMFAETCPQYLLLSRELYQKPDFEAAKWVMSPPLRAADRQHELWDGLASGLIQTVGTDHCSFNFKGQKELGRNDFRRIPNGIPAVGDRFNLLYTYGVGAGRLTLQRFVEAISTMPAKLFGLYPRKGTIQVGSDADLVIFDPRAEGEVSVRTSRHRVDYSAFEGMKLKGLPRSVLLRGRFAVRNGIYVGEQGAGQFLRCSRPLLPAH